MTATPAREAVDSAVDSYLVRFAELVGALDRDAVARVVSRLSAARTLGRTVYVAGNGGSAATAEHFVNDLAKATRSWGEPPFRAMCLSDNTSWVTALANDEGYDRIFAAQLEHFAETEDILVVISASGNSPNILQALELARTRGVITVGLLGFDGGRAKALVDEPVWVETEYGLYGPVETMHVLICDLIVTSLMEAR